MLDDLFNSAKQSLLDRITSPLLGGFAVAWCLWNWKFLMILLSSNTVSQTIHLIERIAFPDTVTLLTQGFLYPLLSALFYVFLYPYPSRLVYEFTLRRQREVNQARQRIAEETPLTLEESRAMRAEFVERERKHAEQVRNLNEEIGRLNALLDKPAAPPEHQDPEPAPKAVADIPYGQINLLRLLESAGSPAPESELIKRSKQPRVDAEYTLGELLRLKLVTRSYSGEFGEHVIEFTHEGRRVLLANRSITEA